MLEKIGHWRDSIVYDLAGEVMFWVKGSAVFDKSGSLKGWTDNAGIIFGKDGQMNYYSERLSTKAALSVSSGFRSLPAIPAFSSVYFEPIKCYDFLPLDDVEEQSRRQAMNNGRQRQSGNQNTYTDALIKTSELLAKTYETQARNADMMKGIEKFMPSSSNRSQESSATYTMKAQELRNKAATLKDKESQRQMEVLSASGSEFIYPERTQTIQLRNRDFISGKAVTEKDSLVFLHYQEDLVSNRPDQVYIYAYNGNNALLQKADQDYSYSHALFDSACRLYEAGDYAIAFQWARLACKKRSTYVNAHLLSCACARMMENYDLALAMLEKIEQQEYQGAVKAFEAELYFLLGDKEKAARLLNQSLQLRAGDWASYIQRKYAIK